MIAGEAPASSTYLQRLHEMAKGDSRIRFLGRVQGPLLEELFSNPTLFAQPSELEGLSIGLIEAMSYGAPCLASDIPENVEVVGDTGLLFQNKNAIDLQRKLSWALAHQEAIQQLAILGRERAQQLFNWDRVVDQLEALYERAAQGSRKAVSSVLQQPAA